MTEKSLQKLRESRSAKAREIRNLLDPAVTTYDAKAQKKVDALYGEVDQLDAQIGQLERYEILDRDLSASAARGLPDSTYAGPEAARRAFVNALRHGAEKLDPREAALVDAAAPAQATRIRNVAEGAPATGGVLVPTIVMPSLLNKLKAFGGMREVARQVETTSGGPISWATLDDTSSTSELVAENISASPGDLAFGAVTSTAAKFSSKIVPISFELLKDSRIDIEKVVLDALAVRLARAMNYYFTIGTGIGQPQGAVGAASLGFQMAVGNTGRVDSDGLMSLFHSVDLAYRYSPSAAFMMHDQTFKAVKQLKDSNSRPLWLPATESALAGDGDFDTLMGARLVINQDMSPMAANAKSILFGDWSKYLIRDVRESLIMRFTDSAYAKFGQVGFLAFARADGRFIDAGNANSISLAYLQNSST